MTLEGVALFTFAAVQTVYAALTYHKVRATSAGRAVRTQPIRSVLVIAICTTLTWLAVGFSYYDRHFAKHVEVPVLQWGVGTNTFHLVVDTSPLRDEKDSAKLVLVVRTSFADIDPMTDTAIEKSSAYTITGGVLPLAVVGTGKIRLAALQENLVEFDLILLPVRHSPEQIRSLGDVESLGGKLLATRSTITMGGPSKAAP